MIKRLGVAVRAWTIPDSADRRKRRKNRNPRTDLGPSRWSLVFDTETTTDEAQRLRFGSYQVRFGDRLRESGFFYDPDVVTSKEFAILEAFTSEHGLRLLDWRDFVEKVFFRIGWDRRGLVIGHNLPFDISRLAIDHYSPQSRDRLMRGGFTFKLCEHKFHPRVQVKRISSRAAFIRFAISDGRHSEARNREKGGLAPNHRGYFVDTATLAGALFSQKLTLKKLAELLNTEHQKLDADHGDEITPEYLSYAMNDVKVTCECFVALRDRYESFGLTKTRVHRILSEASVGKAHLREMGIASWREVQSEFPNWIIAAILETYYGGRCECHIRHVATPGQLVDFGSQYPTCFVLQELWPYVIAQSLEYEEADLREIQVFLDAVTLDDVLRRGLWRKLHVLVLVAPDNDLLPTRAPYGATSPRTPKASKQRGKKLGLAYNVGIERRSGKPQWWTLADCIVAKISTGRAPRVLQALRFRPGPPQEGLKPINVAGYARFRVDPASEDFIKRLCELRASVKQERDSTKACGDLRGEARLDAVQLAMKTTANAISYGTPIEMNVTEHRKKVGVTVHLPNGTSYQSKVTRTEEPGARFHPLLATLVAAGGRLLLAAAMRLVADAGGTYTFCDTDSLFIVSTEHGGVIPCPGGADRTELGDESVAALSCTEVDAVVARFESLNPFDRNLVPGSIFELEKENFDPDTRQRREIWAFSIASKRYALFEWGPDGRPVLIRSGDRQKRSEHGLGGVVSPTSEDAGHEDRSWIDHWWEHLLCVELKIDDPEPEWFAAPAVGRLSVTAPRIERTFAVFNRGRPYAERVRPFNFMITAHAHRMVRLVKELPHSLAAPFTKERGSWLSLPWFARNERAGRTYKARVGDPEYVIAGEVALSTYGDLFDEYRSHPEAKSAGPDGEPCKPWTRGLLQPRVVVPDGDLMRIGKEANRLVDEPELVDDPEDLALEYPRKVCPGCGADVTGRRKWCSEACRKRFERGSIRFRFTSFVKCLNA